MRHSWFLPAFLITCTLGAGSPWEELLQRRRDGNARTARWALCLRPEDSSPAARAGDPVFQKLLTGGDFILEPLGAAAAQDLWNRRGWGAGPHWLLLTPGGEEAGCGAGMPRGEEVLDAIHARGGQPRWEAREEFLREHPDQGEALMESLNQAFQLLRVRVADLDRAGKVQVPVWREGPQGRGAPAPSRIRLAGPQGEAMADELYGEVAGLLERILALPDWELEAGSLASHLARWDVGQSSRMRRLCAQAARSLEQALRQEPYDPELAAFWVEAADAAGQPLDHLEGLCVPVPGDVWPEAAMVSRFLDPSLRRRDWSGALKILSGLVPQGPPEPVTPRGWEDYCRLQGALNALRALALAGQGSRDLAGQALGEARHWAGRNGLREATVLGGAHLMGSAEDAMAWRRLLAQALDRGGDPPPMPTSEPPLRLVVGGMPRWILEWAALRQAPELAPWSPSELRWEAADRLAHENQGARHGWAPGPRWALYRGEELRATGTACPGPRGLAALLENQGPPMLQRLQRLLEAQPDHLAARRERFDLLLRRMPDPRLEPVLAQDAARALVALEFEPSAPWLPDPGLWAQAAQQALPALEQTIRSWPNRAYLWRAWLSWAQFHPRKPSVLALAQATAFWSPGGDWRAWLPYEVQRAVAAELRRQGSYLAMREWFRSIWDHLDHRPLAALRQHERPWVLERRREEETAVFNPLRDALMALGCKDELNELERMFAEMMGRTPPRRP